MLYFTEDAEKKGADVIGKIQKEFAIAMKTSNPDLDITISAGGALRNAGEDFKDLYKKADTALYLAKKEKGQLKIYKDLFCGNRCKTGQFLSVQVGLMHVYSADLVVIIGGIIINSLCGIAAGGIKSNLIFSLSYFAAASLLVYRT